ncbi:glycosyltransferase [uncultured Friedmanniella sp.]|uniref:glycosyltransferase n=1 Tax=uncultured Friedmanniella sp. TaxID=335381 RepID=UPI0035CC75E2
MDGPAAGFATSRPPAAPDPAPASQPGNRPGPTAGASAGGPRTVLHVFGVLDRGGAELRTLEVVQGLAGEPVRFLVCTLTGRAGGLAERYRKAEVQVVPLALRSPAFALRFVRLLRRERVDVVHSHVLFGSGVVLAVAALAGVGERIAHFRSDGSAHTQPSPLRRLRYALLRRLILLTATQVLGVAPGTLDANWGTGWHEDRRFSVLPSGVELDVYRGPAGPLRRELALPPGAALVLHLGRADIATKNRGLAVRVVAEARRRGADVHLVFVGRDGRDTADARTNRDVLARLAETEGAAAAVHFLGERSDVPGLLAAADLLLSTSSREGLPGVLLEAAASGVPVVSSDVPGARFIADEVPGISIVRLADDVSTWADTTLATLAGPGRDELLAADALRGSIFDLDTCLERYRRLWRVR